MAVSNPPEVVDFDASEALGAARSEVAGPLYAFVEYDAESFNPLYVDESTMGFYDGEEEMYDHFAEIHSYVHIDFTEVDLFTDTLFPVAEEVRHVTTAMDYLKLVRVYDGHQGVFLALDPEEPVDPLVDAIRDAFDGRE